MSNVMEERTLQRSGELRDGSSFGKARWLQPTTR